MSENGRSSRELRQALVANRERMETDLATLGERIQEGLNLRHWVARHPILVASAGALFGILVVRRPDIVMRAAGRLAGWGVPLLLSALLRRESRAGDGSQIGAQPQE